MRKTLSDEEESELEREYKPVEDNTGRPNPRGIREPFTPRSLVYSPVPLARIRVEGHRIEPEQLARLLTAAYVAGSFSAGATVKSLSAIGPGPLEVRRSALSTVVLAQGLADDLALETLEALESDPVEDRKDTR